MPASRDYYEVLGVPRSASADDIRKAHRTLARKFHPDINKSDDAATRFKEIQQAYEVLGDEKKRQKYDDLGHRAYASGAGSNPWGPQGGVQWGARGAASQGPDFGTILEQMFGGGAAAGAGARRGARARSQPTKGESVEREETVPFDLAIRGGDWEVRVARGGSTQTFSVRLPKGLAPGTKLRVKGAGRPSPAGGPPGDLILLIRVAPHPVLRRDGLDLAIDTPLSIAEATLGAEIRLPTPGGPVTLTIPPGSASGKRLRLKGRGVEDEQGRRGDLYAVLQIVTPESMTEQDRALLKEIGTRLPCPRTGREWSE